MEQSVFSGVKEMQDLESMKHLEPNLNRNLNRQGEKQDNRQPIPNYSVNVCFLFFSESGVLQKANRQLRISLFPDFKKKYSESFIHSALTKEAFIFVPLAFLAPEQFTFL